MTFDSHKQLEDALARWQRVLRLQDWIVDARIARASEMSGDNKAQVDYNTAERLAVVKLLDPQDYRGNQPQDHEVSLVHELLHLQWAALDPVVKGNSIADLVIEQAVRSNAVLLVQLVRTIQSVSQRADDRQTENNTSTNLDELEPAVV